jgi:hypothetical protein
MKFFKILITMLFIPLLFACSSKYQAPKTFNTPVQGMTKAQVKQAILGASTQGNAKLGTWTMQALDNNTIQARLFNRSYEVVVNIPYSAKGYSINYVSASSNLKNKRGDVHRNYNRWVNNLDAKIKKNLVKTQ